MSKKSVAKVLVGVLLGAALICGCATGPEGPTDEEQIMGRLETLKAGVLDKDIEKVTDLVSADFYYSSLGDKDAALSMLRQGMDIGVVDDGEIDLSEVVIKVDGDAATAGPIEAGNPYASATVQFDLKKEDGVWRIVGGQSDGY